MEKIKKYRWVIVFAIAFVCGFILKWIWSPPDVRDDLSRIRTEKELLAKKHHDDSVTAVHMEAVKNATIDSLKELVNAKQRDIIRLRAENKAKVERIRELPPDMAVEYFSGKTGMESKLMADSNVISPMPAITIANMLMFERDAFADEIVALEDKSALQDSIIVAQYELIGIKDKRIVGLTNDYYAGQRINAEQDAVIKKQRRNIRTKNALVGVLGGLVTTAIVVSIVK